MSCPPPLPPPLLLNPINQPPLTNLLINNPGRPPQPVYPAFLPNAAEFAIVNRRWVEGGASSLLASPYIRFLKENELRPADSRGRPR